MHQRCDQRQLYQCITNNPRQLHLCITHDPKRLTCAWRRGTWPSCGGPAQFWVDASRWRGCVWPGTAAAPPRTPHTALAPATRHKSMCNGPQKPVTDCMHNSSQKPVTDCMAQAQKSQSENVCRSRAEASHKPIRNYTTPTLTYTNTNLHVIGYRNQIETAGHTQAQRAPAWHW